MPPNEKQRLEYLQNLAILDTPPQERFDRITRFANELLGTPISLISLVDSDRQWFKSVQGLDIKETSRDVSFCAHAIIQEQAFFVEDATKDERFRDNPLVTGSPNIRMYAGYPIAMENGLRIGTVCVIDNKPRKLAIPEKQILQHLAEWVKAEIRCLELEKTVKLYEARQENLEKKSENREKLYDFFNSLTLIDPELLLPNTVYLNLFLTQEINRLRFGDKSIAAIAIALDNFSGFEKALGSGQAAIALKAIAKSLSDYPKWPRGMTFRLSRDHFVVILPERTRAEAVEMAELLRDQLHQLHLGYGTGKIENHLTACFGICSVPAAGAAIDKLLVKAHEALELGQRQGSGKIKYADLL